MIIGTIASAGYMAQAMALAQSIKSHMPHAVVVVGVLEESIPQAARHCPWFDEVLRAKDLLGAYEPSKLFFQYDVHGAASLCKPYLLQYLYQRYANQRHIIYMDADMYVYGPLVELEAELEANPIVLSERYLNIGSIEREQAEQILSRGIYQGGLIGIARHAEVERLLANWTNIPNLWDSVQDLLQTLPGRQPTLAQLYMSLIHSSYDHVSSLRHPGYNIGSWNLLERWEIVASSDGSMLVGGKPLRCMHYEQGFVESLGWLEEKQAGIYGQLYEAYRAQLYSLDSLNWQQVPWSYASFVSGEAILPATRWSYARFYYTNPEIPDPFQLSNAFFHSDESVARMEELEEEDLHSLPFRHSSDYGELGLEEPLDEDEQSMAGRRASGRKAGSRRRSVASGKKSKRRGKSRPVYRLKVIQKKKSVSKKRSNGRQSKKQASSKRK